MVHLGVFGYKKTAKRRAPMPCYACWLTPWALGCICLICMLFAYVLGRGRRVEKSAIPPSDEENVIVVDDFNHHHPWGSQMRAPFQRKFHVS